MKMVLLSAAALATAIAAPAFAATNHSGGDGVGTYEITGTAADYCVLGQATAGGTSGGHNVTVDVTTPNGGGYNGTTSDAMINITQFQNTNDHAASWEAVLNLRHSVCNTAYTVTANSQYGGLQYQGTQTGGSDFFKKTAYTVEADFGGKDGNPKEARSLQNGGTLLTSNKASSGDFRLTFDGAADASKYLLSGDYTDTVVVTLAPNTGTDA